MRKCIFLSLLIISVQFIACKKEDNKDYSSLFKNTVWTGEFNYTGQSSQALSLEFKNDGTLWRWEMSKFYSGTYTVTGNKLKVTFGNNMGFDAEITKDNKLRNIKNFTINDWALVNAELNSTPDILLDNTKWKAPGITLEFIAGNHVIMSNNAGTSWTLNYTRKPKSIIFFSSQWYMFTVISNATSMKGANQLAGETAVHPFSVTKE